MVIKRNIFSLFILLSCLFSTAQKVGLVLSGGGASGLAHIGVLKSLEENKIPIDYITGTSMGALVGAMYSIGYSPAQIEKILISEEFKNLAYGTIPNKYIYYFKKKEETAAWTSFKLSLDSSLSTNLLPTNVISPIPIDFALMEMMAAPIAAANYNFDSLFIPFRCLASDIERKQSVVFRKGDLGEAIRASLSYPFYLKPVTIDGRLLYDGGIYNNFPSNVMFDDFYPDIIIGSNVTNNVPPPSEDNLISQLKTMLLTKTNFDILCENGVIIEPVVNRGTFDFDDPLPIIDSGYVAAQRKIAKIKSCLYREADQDELNKKRALFSAKQKALEFNTINIEGLNKRQSNYARKLLVPRKKTIPVEKIKPEYFRLAKDDKINQIFPKALYDKGTGYYDLNLKIKKEKDLLVQVGGNISNRPISGGFLGVQYNYMGNIGISVMGNSYFGKLYNSAQVKVRFDFPSRLKFYVEPNFTANRWDFFTSSNAAFFIDTRPSYLIQKDQYGEMNLGIPIGTKGKMVAGTALASITNNYYQADHFLEKDTADKTVFETFTSHLYYERNTLNRKQYASEGSYTAVKFRYIQGEEYTQPGSTSINKDPLRRLHEWFQIKAVYDKYYIKTRFFKTGLYFEGVYSGQTLFNNYTASILTSPAFQPIPESKTLFQEGYRAHKYIAGGLKNIISVRKNIDLRIEAYIYQPYQQIIELPDRTAGYTSAFSQRFLIATASLVGHTPLGPISLSTNYYNREDDPFTFLFHFGYFIFNKKALD